MQLHVEVDVPAASVVNTGGGSGFNSWAAKHLCSTSTERRAAGSPDAARDKHYSLRNQNLLPRSPYVVRV